MIISQLKVRNKVTTSAVKGKTKIMQNDIKIGQDSQFII